MGRRGEGKLYAYQRKGGNAWNADRGENVLYLGAAQGVTAKWVSELVPEGKVLAVEKSEVAGLGLLDASEDRANLYPHIGDARRPTTYAPLVPELGILYMDVAQPDQLNIFERNLKRFGARRGFLCVKARSIAVERSPQEVIEECVRELERRDLTIVDVRRLDPFHKDHAMIVADPKQGPR
ncbi:MAG: fibrillarin-like rRNA/tRNA 2'-O-methyltransferase [Candidatus Thermoplasmatota archaeon]|nr:fibrillarin-like rRNA/tRNA 2'-O-methyltransferase [Candidatus Thermoplasmatota archaeon]